jgi:hypothetical protein
VAELVGGGGWSDAVKDVAVDAEVNRQGRRSRTAFVDGLCRSDVQMCASGFPRLRADLRLVKPSRNATQVPKVVVVVRNRARFPGVQSVSTIRSDSRQETMTGMGTQNRPMLGGLDNTYASSGRPGSTRSNQLKSLRRSR